MAALLALGFALIGFAALAFGLDGLQVPVGSLYGNAIFLGAVAMFVAGGFYGVSKEENSSW